VNSEGLSFSNLLSIASYECNSKSSIPSPLAVQGFQFCAFRAFSISVTAPILRVPDEGTVDAEKHLEALFEKLPERGGVKVAPLVGFRLLSHPLSHLGVLQAPAY
jgi:hypothetical protein